MSLSADGTLLALFVISGDLPDGDIGRSLFVNEVVNSEDGQSVSVPVGGSWCFSSRPT